MRLMVLSPLFASGEVVGALSVGAHVPVPEGYPDNVLSALRAAKTEASSDLGFRPYASEVIG